MRLSTMDREVVGSNPTLPTAPQGAVEPPFGVEVAGLVEYVGSIPTPLPCYEALATSWP